MSQSTPHAAGHTAVDCHGYQDTVLLARLRHQCGAAIGGYGQQLLGLCSAAAERCNAAYAMPVGTPVYTATVVDGLAGSPATVVVYLNRHGTDGRIDYSSVARAFFEDVGRALTREWRCTVEIRVVAARLDTRPAFPSQFWPQAVPHGGAAELFTFVGYGAHGVRAVDDAVAAALQHVEVLHGQQAWNGGKSGSEAIAAVHAVMRDYSPTACAGYVATTAQLAKRFGQCVVKTLVLVPCDAADDCVVVDTPAAADRAGERGGHV